MSARRSDELLEDLLALARQLCLQRWGQAPVLLKLTLPDGREQVEVVPLVPVAAEPPAARPGLEPASAEAVYSGPPWHSADFTVVRWPALGEYRFKRGKQALVVAELWRAMEEGDPERDQAALLKVVESDCTRLRDLFSRSAAWGTLIIQGSTPGTYRLAPTE